MPLAIIHSFFGQLHFNCSSAQLFWRTIPANFSREHRISIDCCLQTTR